VVTFVGQAGLAEAGLDHGGLMKELLEEALAAGLRREFGLFAATPEGLAYPDPAAGGLQVVALQVACQRQASSGLGWARCCRRRRRRC
jgi:hypothetical protein